MNSSSSINRTRATLSGNPSSQRTRRTGEHKVDPKWVGLVIGQKGMTVQALARDAGDGCHINHDRENKGCFTITAWNNSAVTRAKMGIDKLIQQHTCPQKTKTTKTAVPKTHFTPAFGALASDTDSDGEEEAVKAVEAVVVQAPSKRELKQRNDLTHMVRFNGGGSDIKSLKKAGWEQGNAYRTELRKVEEVWKDMTSSAKGKYGGLGKRGWDTFKYEKMGVWNRAQDQQKHKMMLEASKPKPKPGKVAGYDHQKTNWQSLGSSSSTTPTQSLGVWGRKDTLAGVRSEEAVVKPEVAKMTMEVISSKGKGKGKGKGNDDAFTDEAAFMDQGRASQLPTGPKKFKSQVSHLPKHSGSVEDWQTDQASYA